MDDAEAGDEDEVWVDVKMEGVDLGCNCGDQCCMCVCVYDGHELFNRKLLRWPC